MIHCKARLFKIHDWTILQLPKEASANLPSRGQNMIKGTINGCVFQMALEPDGKGSHWFRVDADMQKSVGIKTGDTVTLEIEPAKEWPQPDVPHDLQKALSGHAEAQALWKKITPLARWEWIRWINATSQAETRRRRIEVSLSKMQAGERRPCCFNRNMCCVPQVSKSGVLLAADE